MYNLLLIENIDKKSISILNTISLKIPNIKILNITCNINEISNILKNKLVDLILLEENINNFQNFINCIKSYSYENKLITIGNDISVTINKIKNYIFIDLKNINTLNQLINTELKNLNFNFSYIGTKYLADTILEICLNTKDFEINLQNQIYPLLSKKHKKSINNIKSNIHYSLNMMYCNTSSIYLINLLGLDITEYKPKVKDIATYILKKIYYQ